MKITNPKTYLISDTHFFHLKIIEYGRPKDFQEQIIKNWNNSIKKDDVVLSLGDFTLGNKEETKLLVDKLNGKKFMIKGNHDRHSDTWYKDIGIEIIEPCYKVRRTRENKEYIVIFSHEPINISQKNIYNIHGHLHGSNHHEGGKTPKHRDISCECTNYAPILLEDIYNDIELKLE